MEVRFAVAVARRAAGERLNVTALAAELGVSRQQFYVLERRAREGGLLSVAEPRSRRPHRSPGQVSAAVEDLIVLLRKELTEDGWDSGADTIGYWIVPRMAADPLFDGLPAPSRSTINRVLSRRGLVVAQPQKRPRPPSNRFEYPNPNSCWQIDATDWWLADGTKVSIVQIEDDNSRKLLAHDVAHEETSASVWAALSKAMERYGIPFQVLTDRGTAMLGWPEISTEVKANLRLLGVRCVTSRGNHPQTCGKNERVHQTLHQWLRARPAPETMTELQALCDLFEELYNSQRPHQSLGMHTPDYRYSLLPKLGPGAELDPLPASIAHNTVSARGSVGATSPNGKTFQLGLGRQWEGCQVIVMVQDLHAAVFYQEHLVAEFTLDPDRLYQGSGRPNNASRQVKKPRVKDVGVSAMS